MSGRHLGNPRKLLFVTFKECKNFIMNIIGIIILGMFVLKIADLACFYYLQSKGDIPKEANYWDGD